MKLLVRAHMPLVILAGGFLALVSGAQCASTDVENTADAGRSVLDASDDSSTRSCTGDADCFVLPPSTCVSSVALAYYTDPKCVQSHCQWTAQVKSCSSCVNGGCNLLTTTTGGFPGTGGAGGMPNDGDAADDHATIDPPEGGVCDVDASADSTCPLPQSVCADSHWLGYFVNPVCSVDGQCQWEIRYRQCLQCSNGGCRTSITL